MVAVVDHDGVLRLVEQPGLLVDAPLRPLDVLDVGAGTDPPLHVAVGVEHRLRPAEHPPEGAVGIAQPVLDLIGARRPGRLGPQHHGQPTVVGVEREVPAVPETLLETEAREVTPPPVEVGVAAVRLGDPHQLRHGLDDLTEVRLARPEHLEPVGLLEQPALQVGDLLAECVEFVGDVHARLVVEAQVKVVAGGAHPCPPPARWCVVDAGAQTAFVAAPAMHGSERRRRATPAGRPDGHVARHCSPTAPTPVMPRWNHRVEAGTGMRTMVTIGAIVVAIAAACVAAVVLLVQVLGVGAGMGVTMASAVALLVTYRRWVQPWQHRWGATDDEVARPMPGDEVIADAAVTTRAIGIDAPPEQVWPWLVQIGYGRAGWYSYDWIDNDGRRSATSIRPELQSLSVGDRIVMVPGMGPIVRDVRENAWILSGDEDGGTWCLAVHPDGAGGTRLISRWRVGWRLTPASAFWILLSDPGAFVMERRMLLGIKARAEAAAARPPSATIIPLVAIALLLTACAADANLQAVSGGAGFWLGLWHGLIAPVTFVISLFSDGARWSEDLGVLVVDDPCAAHDRGPTTHRQADDQSDDATEHEDEADDLDVEAGDLHGHGERQDGTHHDQRDAPADGHVLLPLPAGGRRP